ncbi:hypothetical protein DDZ15_15065 [Rhodohalobacter mucosus]|uniref:Uncharacterized protein n=2 Tax=Rhodohalobacter mucosus TaxID=2079485 RepID=A0A316TQT6_9BACT|nr:hypothetical protein DDZ15_15065 [Rhodohalobacter mucosus]
MINQDFEMKNSIHLFWFYWSVIIDMSAGTAAAGRIEDSKRAHFLQKNTAGAFIIVRAESKK